MFSHAPNLIILTEFICSTLNSSVDLNIFAQSRAYVCACQVRAVDLAMRLHLERSYDIAIQLAQRAQSTKLAQRIHILKRAKFGELAIDSEEEEDEEGPGPFCGNIYGMQSYILSCTHKPPTV